VVGNPVDATELREVDPVSNEMIYLVRNGKTVAPDFRREFSRRCGVCVQACLYGVIRIAGPWDAKPEASVQ